MDKKTKDMSYREVHKKLEDAMQDVFTSDEAGPFGSPEIDYSFMDDAKEKKTRKMSGMNRFNKVAAIIIIVLLGMNVVMMATGSSVSYSEKGLLHRIYEGARGIFTDEDESEYVEIDETGDVYTITEKQYIYKAKKIWKEIYVPIYIPKDFEFKELVVCKYMNNKYWAKYTYTKDSDILTIEEMSSDDSRKVLAKDFGQVVQYDDRIACIYSDKKNDCYIADVYFDDLTLCITCNLSYDEIKTIIEHLD